MRQYQPAGIKGTLPVQLQLLNPYGSGSTNAAQSEHNLSLHRLAEALVHCLQAMISPTAGRGK